MRLFVVSKSLIFPSHVFLQSNTKHSAIKAKMCRGGSWEFNEHPAVLMYAQQDKHRFEESKSKLYRNIS